MAIYISSQVITEQLDATVLGPISFVRNMRGDEDAFIIPETEIWFVLKLSNIDIQSNPPELPNCERFNQCFFVDDFPACNVDQHGSWFHGCEGFSVNQFCGLRRPLTANSYELTLTKKFIEMAGILETAELG